MAGLELATSASRLEHAINTLTARLERQEAEVEMLREELASRPTEVDLAAARDAALAGIQGLERRIAALEEATVVPGLGRHGIDPAWLGDDRIPSTVGEAVMHLAKRCVTLESFARDGASRLFVVEELRGASSALRSSIDELSEVKASKEAVAA
jgi:hypothetical protein